MRQDRYVELFGEHRALLQVIRVVKRQYTIGCDVWSGGRCEKYQTAPTRKSEGINESSSYVRTMEAKI